MPNMTRRQAIGLAAGAGTLGVLGAIGSMLAPRLPDEMPAKAYDSMLRPPEMPLARDVASYMSEVSRAIGGTGEVEDRFHHIRVRNSFVDAAVVPAGTTLTEMWTDEVMAASGLIASYDSVATAYDVGRDDVYAVLVDPSRFNGAGLDLSYVAFTRDHDFAELVDGCSWDRETGIALVPKTAWTDEDGQECWGSMRIQTMVRADIAQGISCAPKVTVHSTDPSFPVIAEPEVTDDGFCSEFRFRIAEPPRSRELGRESIRIWVSGIDAAVDPIDRMWAYDPDTGTIAMRFPGATCPGVEVLVTPMATSVAAMLLPRRALAFDSWDEGAYWPWGYLRYDPSMDTMMANMTMFTYDCGGSTTAIDGTLWDDGAAGTANIILNYCSRNIHQLNEVLIACWDGIHDDYDIDEQTNETLLRDAHSANRNLTWTQLEQWKANPDNWGDFYANAHFIVLPGCDIATNHTYKDKAFWSTIKNVDFDNATMIGTSAENDARYNSCVIAHADCAHSEASTDPDGDYKGPIYCRIIGMRKTGNDPYVVISFHTKGFGSTDPHGVDISQSAEAVLKFHLQVGAWMTLQKGVGA